MKKAKFMPLFAALVVAVTLFPVLVHGDTDVSGNANVSGDTDVSTDTDSYSSDTDPLVSLSYINEVVKPEYDKKIEELTAKVDKLSESITLMQNSLAEANEKIAALSAADSATAGIGQYEVVFMEKGSKLMAKTPCEIILRTGSAIAVSIISNGLNDITDGTEILNASEIPLYHSLLVPRGNDGRGIQITSADAYVMVRGEYEIVQ